MAKYPYLPLWTDAYLADTRHLSTLEHGAYLLLLFEAWRRPRCTLPNNDELLARLAGLSAGEWAKVRTVVMAFWKIDKRSKEWTQIRLTRERMYVDRKSGVQRDRIVKYWKEKKKTDTVEVPRKYQVDTADIPPTPTPTLIKERLLTESKESAKSAIRGSRLEIESLPEAWAAWALENTDQDPTEVWPNFRDYWIAAPGQRGVKRGERGWFATWRNWCRKNDKQKSNGKASSYSDLLARTQRVTDQLMKGSDDELPSDDTGQANGGKDSRKLPRHPGKP